MKFCQRCGEEIMDEEVFCPGCGCSVENTDVKKIEKISTFKRNRKRWIIVLSALFAFFAIVTVLILVSRGFDDTIDMYQYYHSDLGTLGKRVGGTLATIEWEQKVNALKTKLVFYYVAIGICGVLALASLAGDIHLFVTKNKDNQ